MKRFVRSYKTRVIKNAAEFTKHYKKKLQCSYCEFSLEPAALHFHHINPKDKKHELSKLFATGDVELLLQELSICTVLCANCHAIYHYSEDAELSSSVALSFKPIDLDLFLSCVEEFGQTEESIQFEFSDDTELIFKELAKGESYEPNESLSEVTSLVYTKRRLEDLTEQDKALIISLYSNDYSLKKISRTVFGDNKWGGFYNRLIKQVIEEAGQDFDTLVNYI